MSERRHYRVEGMTCAACAVTIQGTLAKVPTVRSAEVSYAGKAALVELQAGADDAQALSAVRAVGYALVEESLDPTQADAAQQVRLRQLGRRVAVSATFALPVFILGMWVMHAAWSPWVQLALSTPVMLIGGREFFTRAVKLLRHGHANMDTLVALGTGTAYLFSLAVTLWPRLGHESLWGHAVYYESAVVVVTLVLLGRYLEERAHLRTSEAVRSLVALQPQTAIRVGEEGEREVPLDQVAPGDILRIRPGDRIPVDGVVASGTSAVDESMLTGESMPVQKEIGSPLYAGTLNTDGSLLMTAENTGFATRLSRIIRLVREAQASRAPIQRLVDRISAVFVPLVVMLALAAAIAWGVWGPEPRSTNALVVAVTLLVVACPCALGLATPTAIMVGVGRGAAEGILIREARSLEAARQVTDLILDKTGTITHGKPAVTGFLVEAGMEHSLPWVLATEKQSAHPLAAAWIHWLETQGVPLGEEPVSVLNLSGKGLMARFGDQTLRVGSWAWAKERGVRLTPEAADLMRQAEARGEGLAVATVNDKLAMTVTLADTLKPGAKELVAALHRRGITVWMLTGDAEAPALAVAVQVGLPAGQVRHDQKPEDKLAWVRHLQAEGKKVALVGDGINDGPALVAADLGIAVGTGSDTALESAGVVLRDGSLERVLGIFSLSQATVATLRRNLFWAFLYNIVMLPLAGGALYPFTGWVLDPMWAGAAMAASSISVVGSSLLLRRWRMPEAKG